MKRTIVSYTFAFVALMFMQARGAYLVTASRDYVDKQVAAVKTNIIISVEAATNDMWHAISDKAEKEISYSKTVFTPPQLSTNDVWLMSADYLEPGDEIVMRYGSRGSFGDNGDCDRWVGDDTLRTALAFDYNDSVWIVTNVNSIAQQGGFVTETNLVFSLVGADSVMLTFNRRTESITNGTYSVVYEDELEDIISSVEPKNYEAVSSAALSAIQSVSVNGTPLATNENRSVNVVVPIPATLDLPIISGDANVGESDKFAREDHVHPAETKVLAYAIPDAYFPMSYTSNETNYTVSCNDELRFDVESVYIYMYNVDKSLCIAKFNKTAPYAYGALGSLLVSNLKFNMDGTPTDPETDSWPTLRDDAAYVRDVQVARESDVAEQLALKANDGDVLKNSGSQTLTGTLSIDSSNAELRIGDGGVDDQHARLFQDELQVSDGGVLPNTKLAHYRYDKIQVQSGSITANLTLPLTNGTFALLSDIYAAVQQIAPEFDATHTPSNKYERYDLCAKDSVVYQCTNSSGHFGAWNADNWQEKKVSELFLPLTGGRMSGALGVYPGGTDGENYIEVGRSATDCIGLTLWGLYTRSGSVEKFFSVPNNGGTLAVVGDIPTASTNLPNGDGAASAGSATTWSKSDHVHPTDTSRAPVESPVFSGEPKAPDIGTNTISRVATKNYVDRSIPTIPSNVSAFANDAGYLVGDFTILTNNAEFTSAVAAVSPPTDLTGYAQIITDPANIPASGYALLITENESYLTNITEQVSGNVTNIVTTVTTNSYPVLALYSDGTKVWTSDPSEQGTGYYVALILAIMAAAGGFVWRFFAKTTNILKVDPETGGIYYETED